VTWLRGRTGKSHSKRKLAIYYNMQLLKTLVTLPYICFNVYMATRKMTFTLPADIANLFVRRVPARDRSRYVAAALAEKLTEADRQLMRACEIANQDPEVAAIEQEFDALPSEMMEPWTDAPAR
jgi:hypothetical protein